MNKKKIATYLSYTLLITVIGLLIVGSAVVALMFETTEAPQRDIGDGLLFNGKPIENDTLFTKMIPGVHTIEYPEENYDGQTYSVNFDRMDGFEYGVLYLGGPSWQELSNATYQCIMQHGETRELTFWYNNINLSHSMNGTLFPYIWMNISIWKY